MQRDVRKTVEWKEREGKKMDGGIAGREGSRGIEGERGGYTIVCTCPVLPYPRHLHTFTSTPERKKN